MYDVGIVGAGVHGASIAFHLASSGARTVVFERGVPAGGPTGRSSGICRAYYTNAFLARMARDGISMLASFAEHTGRTSDFRRTGMLYLHPPDDEARVLDAAAGLRDLGIRTEVMDANELVRRYPMFDPAGVGVAVLEPDAGHADPAAVTVGFLQAALELGAVARTGSEVTDLEDDPAGVAVVTADGDRTVCRRVMIAAGPWTRALARRIGVELPLTVERHVVASFAWGGARPVPQHGDLVLGHYLRPEGEALYLVGTLHPAAEVDPDGCAQRLSQDEVAELAALVTARAPELERSEVREGWASLYDVSPDWQPVIGEIAPGVFVDAGTSGHGFKLAPALGREVAKLVLDEGPDPELDRFHPARFAEERTLAAGYRDAPILG